jgi:hypothetical protein
MMEIGELRRYEARLDAGNRAIDSMARSMALASLKVEKWHLSLSRVGLRG